MKLTGYDYTIEPTGVHEITLKGVCTDDELKTIGLAYYNEPGICQLISLTGPYEKENKSMNEATHIFTDTEICRMENRSYNEGYKKGYDQRGKLDEIVNGRLRIKKVIFNDPATIVFWADGTKTVAKAHGDDKFDKEVGLTVCIAKKALGNRSNFDKVFKKWIK